MGHDAHLIEKRLGGRTLLSGGFLEVRKDDVQLPDGSHATREYIRHGGAVAIVPLFETMTRQAQLAVPSAATNDIYALGETILRRWWGERERPALRLLGVTLSGFAAAAAQPDLFAAAPPRRANDALVDRINEKFGGGAIRRATGLKNDD